MVLLEQQMTKKALSVIYFFTIYKYASHSAVSIATWAGNFETPSIAPHADGSKLCCILLHAKNGPKMLCVCRLKRKMVPTSIKWAFLLLFRSKDSVPPTRAKSKHSSSVSRTHEHTNAARGSDSGCLSTCSSSCSSSGGWSEGAPDLLVKLHVPKVHQWTTFYSRTPDEPHNVTCSITAVFTIGLAVAHK